MLSELLRETIAEGGDKFSAEKLMILGGILLAGGIVFLYLLMSKSKIQFL